MPGMRLKAEKDARHSDGIRFEVQPRVTRDFVQWPQEILESCLNKSKTTKRLDKTF
jgi:hypothetical protein